MSLDMFKFKKKSMYVYAGLKLLVLVVWFKAIVDNDFLKIIYGHIDDFFAYTRYETIDLAIAFGLYVVMLALLGFSVYTFLKYLQESKVKHGKIIIGMGVLVFLLTLGVLFVDPYGAINFVFSFLMVVYVVVCLINFVPSSVEKYAKLSKVAKVEEEPLYFSEGELAKDVVESELDTLEDFEESVEYDESEESMLDEEHEH